MIGFAAFAVALAWNGGQSGPTPSPRTAQEPSPMIVPWPKSVVRNRGVMPLKATARIVAADPGLLPLAKVLAGELLLTTGLDLQAESGRSKPGDIVLKLTQKLRGEAYELEVSDRASVQGGDYHAVALGSATLLQSCGPGKAIPKIKVSDQPAAGYRGLMIDVARQYHSIDNLKQCVELCRLYKIRYLQLHLSDDQACTFPSTAYPLLTATNRNGGPAYTLAQLKDLVRFADERGVTIIPEFEVPGHAASMVRNYPDLFKIAGTKPYEHHATINFANDKVLKAVDAIVGEICDVFKSTPYFHIGGDEADYSLADQHPDFQARFKELGLGYKGQWELYRWFLCRMNEIVRRHGKKMLVWEGFGRDPNSKFPIPKDVTVMEFESAYYLPEDLTADGYTLINAAWTPLYLVNRHVWSPAKVYAWNPMLFGRFSGLYQTTEWHEVKDASKIAGAQVCCWEQIEALEVQNVRKVLPAMAERVWNPSLGRGYDDFAGRLVATDSLLEKLVHVVTFHPTGLDTPGPDDFDCRQFSSPMTLAMSASKPGLTIRYTVNGAEPIVDAPVYTSPIRLEDTTTVRAAAFDAGGRRVGWETGDVYTFVPKPTPNLATGKPVTVSGGTQGPQAPELAVDGKVELASSWWAAPAPQWLKVDLGAAFRVDRVKVFPYWDGSRYYRYTVEASVDGRSWTLIGDKKENTTPASADGDEFKFPAVPIRYVRVNMLKGSANEGVHLVELQVFEAKKS